MIYSLFLKFQLCFNFSEPKSFSRKKRLIVALVCSILASVIAYQELNRFRPLNLGTRSFYTFNFIQVIEAVCTLIRRETPVSVFSVMNILTSENKPTLYNLFMASGISSPGKVILVPAMSEAALIANCVLYFRFLHLHYQ